MKIVLYTFLLTILVQGSTYAQEVFKNLSYPYETHKVSLTNGEQLAYIDEGDGKEVLVFIHGLGSYIPAWNKNIPELKKLYRCIAIDLIGYGKSSKPTETFLLKEQSAFVAELLNSLEIDQYNLVGHSMGGQIAIHHALAYPENVKSLILVAPAGIETFTDIQKTVFKSVPSVAIIQTNDEAIKTNLLTNFYQYTDEAEFMIKDRIAMKDDPQMDLYAEAIVNGIRGMVEQTVYDQLEKIKMPVLVMYGAEDRLIPNKAFNPDLTQQKLLDITKNKIPHADVHLIPEAGHMLMFEQGKKINTLITEFLINTP